MSDKLLRTEDLTKSFGGVLANDSISLEVSSDEIHGLIGPNGAGKTTLFNTITGFHTPSRGRIIYNEKEITGWTTHRIAQQGLGRTFQIPAPFETMSVRDNLFAVHADASRAEKEDRAGAILDMLDLDAVASQSASDLSGGQQKLLELGRALMLNPNCILLDEPTAGVNPALADHIIDHIYTLNDDGTAFLIIEHDMEVMQNLADTVTVLDQGQVIAEGTFERVTADNRVQEAYLGSEPDPEILEVLKKSDATNRDRKNVDTISNQSNRLTGTDIVSGYGEHQVLNGVSIESRPGITGIFGPNGSGKSTLLKTLNGLLPVWSGNVIYNKTNITGTRPEELVQLGITTLQQDSGIFRSLTIKENLRLGAHHIDNDTVIQERYKTVLDTFPVLASKLNDKAESLSGGQRMMLSFGRAMMTGADVYLLDEPSAGLAPSLVDDVFEMASNIAENGDEVILIEQNVRKALEIVDYVYIFSQGNIQFEGRPTELAEREDLLDIYLGIV